MGFGGVAFGGEKVKNKYYFILTEWLIEIGLDTHRTDFLEERKRK